MPQGSAALGYRRDMAQETSPAPFDPDAPPASGGPGLEAFVEAMERARVKALLAPDLPLLRRLHAPDYQLVTPSGRPFDRERYLQDLETRTLRYLRWDIAELRVRATPAMALVRYRATLELDGGGGSGTPFACWHTDSYELRGDRWQAVWSQATAIRAA